jgi:hypothetical protein
MAPKLTMSGFESQPANKAGVAAGRGMSLRAAIGVRFIFWREICHPAFRDFCNTICSQ